MMSDNRNNFDTPHDFSEGTRPGRLPMWLAILLFGLVSLLVVMFAQPAIQKSKKAQQRAKSAKSSWQVTMALAGYHNARQNVPFMREEFKHHPRQTTIEEEFQIQAESAVSGP